jgi:hypothetical protein
MLEPPRQACKDPHVGPHNRCRHPAPPPRGYRACLGDPACAIRVPTTYLSGLCVYHTEEGVVRLHTVHDKYRKMMTKESVNG